ncbi:hypothetical protein H072_6866 [Dactylellina haptotyla CBS 200.50]|uniref:Eukaryotic translation initiation factor 3 subunit M n=1 Tax=Dactylellina haptotyla (strain CBS 200.50) TaxID=1284197 RepID=S8BVS0_DACHA|nr:hypothetical protein H072_6866 [Dactylellina haptotyla CBS 200.50]
MASAVNTLLVEGSFDDQVAELAEYIDSLKGGEPTLVPELQPMLEKGEKEDVMEKLVEASSALSQAPEKEYIPAYNLLIHLIRTSPLLPSLLDTVTANLALPLKNSSNGPSLSLSILTTIFNVLPPNSSLRSEVFRNIVTIVEENGLFEALKPQLKSLDRWLSEWDAGIEHTREVLVMVANVAEKAGDSLFYELLLQALQRFPADEADEEEAQEIAVRVVKAAISLPHHMEFGDLTTLEPIKALAGEQPDLYQLFEIFVGGEYQDLEEFIEERDGWLEQNNIDEAIVIRKMRLLTLASLAASSPDRSLAYSRIATGLRIPAEEVELWVIDVIRAGLVEGKLSQLNQTFLIHRVTYRKFERQEWVEIQNRLETWKESLRNIKEVVAAARKQVENQTEKEKTAAERMLQHSGDGVLGEA